MPTAKQKKQTDLGKGWRHSLEKSIQASDRMVLYGDVKAGTIRVWWSNEPGQWYNISQAVALACELAYTPEGVKRSEMEIVTRLGEFAQLPDTIILLSNQVLIDYRNGLRYNKAAVEPTEAVPTKKEAA